MLIFTKDDKIITKSVEFVVTDNQKELRKFEKL